MLKTLKGKLLSRFMLVAGFTLLLGAVSIVSFRVTQRDLTELAGNSIRSLLLLSKLQAYSKEHILASIKIGYGEKKDIDGFHEEAKTADMKFTETMNLLSPDTDAAPFVKEVESKWSVYLKTSEEAYKKASSVASPEDEKKVHAFVAEDLELAKVELVDSINNLGNHYTVEGEETSSSAIKTTSISLWITIATILVAFAVSSVVGFQISNSLSKEFNNATNSLENVMGELETEADKMLRNSQDLSSSTSTQAASIQETVTAMDEISSMLKRTEDGSKSSEDMASQSARLAKQGHESITSLQIGMQNISEGFNNVVVTFDEANKRFMDIINVIREIDAKTKVINEIVFQTKLLSFNASVEAARAGEHGKGFAVVAEEVGALAGMSGKSASEITEILNSGIQKVQTIIDQNRDSIQRVLNNARSNVDSSKKYVIETQDALNEIVDNSEKTKDSTSEIVQFCKEQTIAVQEITKAIYEIDKSTQHSNTVAHDSEETAHSIEKAIIRLNDVTGNISYQVTGVQRVSEESPSKQESAPSVHERKKAA